jgi:hypothetical protein
MTVLQWADGHDNEAGYVDILLNTAGDSVAIAPGISYEIYENAADGSVKAKGAGSMRITMVNVSFADYIQMRETDLGYSVDPDDISRNVTVTVPRPGLSALDDFNAICVHRPGVDAQLNVDATRYQSVSWLLKIVGAT